MNNHPKTIGSEVPIARTRRKSEVLPGKTECAIVENKKADSPKPDNTNPVELVLCAYNRGVGMMSAQSFANGFWVLTMCSGKLLATALSAPDAPPAPPLPVRKPQMINKATIVVDARSWPFSSPASKIILVPRYPMNRVKKAMTRDNLGPRASTSLP